MSLASIHLRRLLKLMYLPAAPRRAALREDIRSELAREHGISPEGGGGDFFGPFWADVRAYIAHGTDLKIATDDRIAANIRRERLYPLLSTGFLQWWQEKRRWSNEEYEYLKTNLKAFYKVNHSACIVKMENLICVVLGNGSRRLIYPYFSENPPLSDEGARVGLFLLDQALEKCMIDEIRILDVLRGVSFSTLDSPLRGDELDIFAKKFDALVREWEALRSEYP